MEAIVVMKTRVHFFMTACVKVALAAAASAAAAAAAAAVALL